LPEEVRVASFEARGFLSRSCQTRVNKIEQIICRKTGQTVEESQPSCKQVCDRPRQVLAQVMQVVQVGQVGQVRQPAKELSGWSVQGALLLLQLN